ncbi:protein ZW2-like [Actinidia eriantha]|uniref:protein ZW2-like n=1 Tax=Actinidia eriantha TaxID=165200 RepID=UPI002584A4DB|nr:protein ZW2-like [Actinidia eriantha]
MPFGATTSNHHNNAGSFEFFFEGWLVRQEHLLDELLCMQQRCHESHVDDVKDLISRVLSHYQEYYEEKSRAVKRDVFLVFSPTWFTPLERAFFWIAGFRPGLAFRIVVHSVDDMTEDQSRRMRQLMSETKAEERELGNRLASSQESVAERQVLEAARRKAVPREGEVEDVVGALRSAMEAVLGGADSLRMRTAERVVEILSPAQNVRFLAAATQLQVKIRMWGLEREAEREVD